MSDAGDEELDESQTPPEVSEELTEIQDGPEAQDDPMANAVRERPDDEERRLRLTLQQKWFPRIIWGLIGYNAIIFVVVLVLICLKIDGKNIVWQEIVAFIGTGLGGVIAMVQVLLKYLFPSQ